MTRSLPPNPGPLAPTFHAIAPFLPIDWEAPVDVDAYARAATKNAMIRGYFFNAILAGASAAGVTVAEPKSRYLNFTEYPIREFVVFLARAAGLMYPNRSLRQGLRILGRGGYETMEQSLLGKTALGTHGSTLESRIRDIERAYALGMPQASVTGSILNATQVEFVFERTYPFVDSHQVGAIEGALFSCGYKADIVIATTSIASAKMRCTLRPK